MRQRSARSRAIPVVAVASLASVLAAVASGCGDEGAGDGDTIRIGLLLSYTGFLAANSVNSERAVLLAVEQAAGGREALGGRSLKVVARDTRSDPKKVVAAGRALLDGGTAVLIGPDTIDLVTALRPVMQDRTMVLPSYATAADVEFKPPSWFVMGAATKRVACELVSQMRVDGRQKPLLIVSTTGYNSFLAWVLANSYGLPKYVLPNEEAATTATVRPIAAAGADAYLLAAFPTAASPLVHALSAIGAIGDTHSWYLSPTLHTPAFLASIPKGVLTGARGVSGGAATGAADFRTRFRERWNDVPLDDAYPFYDATAVTILALTRAVAREGVVPTGTALSPHMVAVTRPGGELIIWNDLPRGMELLRQGREVSYVGISGPVEFDPSGQTKESVTRWWTIDDSGFTDLPSRGNCE